jgi:hypothetical protein
MGRARVAHPVRYPSAVGGRRLWVDIEERCDVLGAVGVGEEPVGAVAVEALGQHVHEKAADELVRVKPHRLPAARTVVTIGHFEGEIVLWAVRWYCRYGVSYRDLEQMMGERGVSVDHSTIYRWVQKYAPEIEKRLRWQN